MSVRLASIVLPVYNQADHIARVIEEYLADLGSLPFEHELILVVNGHQRDDSLAVCQTLAARFSTVQVFSTGNGGWGGAVRYGLAQTKGDLLCYSNSARTTSDDLMVCLQYGSTHPDCVIKASRKIRSGIRRRLGSLIYNLECRALFDLPYWDINGTPKVFPRRFTDLLRMQRTDDLIDLEFNVICRRRRYQIIEAPIFSSSRHSGQSTTSWKSAFHLYWGAWQLYKELESK